jgi:hypothetical protein
MVANPDLTKICDTDWNPDFGFQTGLKSSFEISNADFGLTSGFYLKRI